MYAPPIIIIFRLIELWGKFVRLCAYALIPFTLYLLLEPESLWSIPLSQLTVGVLFNNFIFAVSLIYTPIQFFKFPSNEQDFNDDVEELSTLKKSPYVIFAKYSAWFLLVVMLLAMNDRYAFW
jgi:hypothetical protein